jgi:hypothetical protein
MLKQLLGSVDLKKPRNWPLVIRVLRGLLAMSSEPDPRLLNTSAPDLGAPTAMRKDS